MNHRLMTARILVALVSLGVHAFAPQAVFGADGRKCGPYDGLTVAPDLVEILKDGTIVKSHSKWLESYPIAGRDSYHAQEDSLRANFCGASAQKISFFVQDLSWANFSRSDIQQANFNGTNLERAVFTGANLQGATMVGTKLAGAFFGDANLAGVRFEPDPSSLPHLRSMRRAHGLESLRFAQYPDALIELREQFKRAGLREHERRITFAIERSKTLLAMETGHWIEACLRYIAFELPTGYGLTPHRALSIWLLLLLICSAVYTGALLKQQPPKIWRIYPKDRIGTDGQEVQEPVVVRGPQIVLTACQFSLLSATQIGWRDVNLGNWVFRLQRTDYAMRSTGWVRVVAGVQSLLGVYLIAMWFLTYFARPFEG